MSASDWTLTELSQSADGQHCTASYLQGQLHLILHMHLDKEAVWVIGSLEISQTPEITTNTLRKLPLGWMRTRATINLPTPATQAANIH